MPNYGDGWLLQIEVFVCLATIALVYAGENDNGYLTLRPGTGSDVTVVLLNVAWG